MARRIKFLPLSEVYFLGLLKEGFHAGYEVIQDAVPEDARILEIRFSVCEQRIEILLESSQFDEVKLGAQIPDHIPILSALNALNEAS